jgi:hypothetical protein
MNVLPPTNNPAVRQLQMQLGALTQRVHRLEAQEHAQRCALQCLLFHWGQAKSTLAAALAADAALWDARYEAWEEPKPDRDEWRAAIDDLIAVLTS